MTNKILGEEINWKDWDKIVRDEGLEAVAQEMRDALADDPEIAARFEIGGEGLNIVLARRPFEEGPAMILNEPIDERGGK